MKIVPEEYTKSAPNTMRTVDGKPKAQYVTDGSIKANKMAAAAVRRVPLTGYHKLISHANIPQRHHLPINITKGNLETTIATKKLHKQPTMNMGTNRIMVSTGVNNK
jgi:hypothetical protein